MWKGVIYISSLLYLYINPRERKEKYMFGNDNIQKLYEFSQNGDQAKLDAKDWLSQ